jgi:hypothetical protein
MTYALCLTIAAPNTIDVDAKAIHPKPRVSPVVSVSCGGWSVWSAAPPPLTNQPSGGGLISAVDDEIEPVESIERLDPQPQLAHDLGGPHRRGDTAQRQPAARELLQEKSDRRACSQAHSRAVLDELRRSLGGELLLAFDAHDPITRSQAGSQPTAEPTKRPPSGPELVSAVLAVILIGGTFGALILGVLRSWFDRSFWLSFLYSLAATLGGVVGGIPAALGINRWQERRSTGAAEARRAAEAVRTAAVVVRVLVEEFRRNEEILASWKRSLAHKEANHSIFSVERWQVLKTSGSFSKLDKGDDVEVLGLFADCYQSYTQFALLASRFLSVVSLDRQLDLSQALVTTLTDLVENDIEPKHALLRRRLNLSP